MAQEQVNKQTVSTLDWNPQKGDIKYAVTDCFSFKVECKDGQIYVIIQEGNTRVKLRQQMFDRLREFTESISYLISFVEANTRRDA